MANCMPNPKTSSFITTVAGNLYRALPSILIGVLLNALDAVSTGLLVFPSAHGSKGFNGLQVQAMSMYLMSTFTSQLTMSLGASHFTGALGSMFIEALPFLRAIAGTIRDVLGDNNPALIPTVMAAYAMTSILIGVVFLALGVLGCGRMVGYFPKTLLSGIIGAIGVSLFALGLSLTLPLGAEPLTLSSTPTVLFATSHIPLLLSSCFPALFLSLSLRSHFFRRITRGATQHALYIPTFILAIAIVFWSIEGIKGNATTGGIVELAERGWLFTIETPIGKTEQREYTWNYWYLFDFTKVEWRAMRGAAVDIVLLIAISVLNLPIFISALALSLGTSSFNMDRELLSNAASNLLAGTVGTVPNMIVFSNSLFFIRAGGGRMEAILVAFFTLVLFFTSSYLLPYIPTLLAGAFVLFIGLELMIESLWESTKTLQTGEWVIVTGTVVACTFLGFAPGVGVGFGVALVMHLWWTAIDSRARSTTTRGPDICDKNTSQKSSSFVNLLRPAHDNCSGDIDVEKNIEGQYKSQGMTWTSQSPHIRVVKLAGYIFFATIPSLEREVNISCSGFVLLDLTQVHRIETSVAIFIKNKARELSAKPLAAKVVLCGLVRHSGTHRDLQRGRVTCTWDGEVNRPLDAEKETMICFETVREAIHWCEDNNSQTRSTVCLAWLTDQIIQSRVSENRRIEILDDFTSLLKDPGAMPAPPDLTVKFCPNPARPWILDGAYPGIFRVRNYGSEHMLFTRGQSVDRVIFIIRGRLLCKNIAPNTTQLSTRPSLSDTITSVVRKLCRFNAVFRGQDSTGSSNFHANTLQILGRGDVLGLSCFLTGEREWDLCDMLVITSPGPCYTVEIDRATVLKRDDWENIFIWVAKVAAVLNERAAHRLLHLKII